MSTYADFTNNVDHPAAVHTQLIDASDGMHVDDDLDMSATNGSRDSGDALNDSQLRTLINTLRSEQGRPQTPAELFDLYDQCIPVFLSHAVYTHLSVTLANGDAEILRFILSREQAFRASATPAAKSEASNVLHFQSWTACVVLRLMANHWPDVFRSLALSSAPPNIASVRDTDMFPVAIGAAESRWASPSKAAARKTAEEAYVKGRQRLEDTRLHANRLASLLEVFEEPETSRKGAESWSPPRWMRTIDDIERLLCASGLLDGERLHLASELCAVGRQLVSSGKNADDAIPFDT